MKYLFLSGTVGRVGLMREEERWTGENVWNTPQFNFTYTTSFDHIAIFFTKYYIK